MEPSKRTIKSGNFLFREGDKAESVFIVEAGLLSVHKTVDSRLQEIARVGERQIVGEMGLFGDAPRSASVKAEYDSVVIEISKQSIKDFLVIQPSWVNILVESLLGKLRSTSEKLAVSLRELNSKK